MSNQPPKSRTETRNNAYDVIDGERDYQDLHHVSPERTLVDDANLLIEYTDKLAADVHALATGGGMSPSSNPLKRLREIAALAVRAMETHGVSPRENHVPASAGITGTVKIVGKADSTKPVPQQPPHPAPAHAPQPAHHTPQPIVHHTTEHGK